MLTIDGIQTAVNIRNSRDVSGCYELAARCANSLVGASRHSAFVVGDARPKDGCGDDRRKLIRSLPPSFEVGP